MDKVRHVAEQIKAQGPEAVNFVRGYIDAQSETGKRDKRFNGNGDYRRGYLAGALNSNIVNG